MFHLTSLIQIDAVTSLRKQILKAIGSKDHNALTPFFPVENRRQIEDDPSMS